MWRDSTKRIAIFPVHKYSSYKNLVQSLPKLCCFYSRPLASIKLMQKRTHSRKRKTVVVSLWVKPEIKAEIKRLAEKDGLSVSKYAGSLLEEGLHQQLHIQHAVLLQPLIEQAISKRMAGISTRLSGLMVR